MERQEAAAASRVHGGMVGLRVREGMEALQDAAREAAAGVIQGAAIGELTRRHTEERGGQEAAAATSVLQGAAEVTPYPDIRSRCYPLRYIL